MPIPSGEIVAVVVQHLHLNSFIMMTIPSVQTTAHTYPHAEIVAMTNFYGGKKCVISLMSGSVEWSHILDAVERSSERQLAMLNPKRIREWFVGPDNSFKRMATYWDSGDVPRPLHPCNERASESLILSCAMTLKVYLLAFANAYAQTASGSTSPTSR